MGVLQLTRLVRETPPGRTVEVKVRRENRDQTFQVTTMRAAGWGRLWPLDIPDSTILRDRVIREIPRVQVTTSYSQAGIRVEQLTDQLRDFFGVYGNEGVLVASVDTDSAAGKAGVKAGDIITAVSSKRVGTPAEFSREMRTAGSRPVLRIIRDKQEREITIE
jgi:S1-C subfamily serine protease